MANKIIGYTAGAFDVFHIGHLNILKNAKKYCDYLIVGVTSDELIYKTKNKYPLSKLEERMEIIESIKYVDEVIIQNDLDKVNAYKKLHFNVLFSGDDWKNTPRWQGYEMELKKENVPIIYFPYTNTVSSTKLQTFIKKEVANESSSASVRTSKNI